MKNPWVGYTNRSFNSIKTAIIEKLKINVPELTDFSPSNLMMVIVDIFAGVAEMINYYIDNVARELFIPTARRLSSVIKLASLVSYNGKAATPSITTVKVQRLNAQNEVILNTNNINFPAHCVLRDTNGNYWLTQEDQMFRSGFYYVLLDVKQQKTITPYILGTSDGTVNQVFELPSDFCHGTLEVTIEATSWEEVDQFAFYGPDEKVFRVAMGVNGKMYLTFGDDVNGSVPTDRATITVNYLTTKGLDGKVGEDTITTMTTILPGPVYNLSFTNPDKSYGGKNIEGLEDLRRAIPLSIYSIDRAVTRKDYEYLAATIPGVRVARLKYSCGPKISIYIVGNDGGNPPQSLLNDVQTYMEEKAIFSIPLEVKPSGELHIKGTLNVTGAYRISASTIQAAIIEALQELYSPYDNNPRRAIHGSDIIATVDNLPEVDYLSLISFYAEPYLRPSNLNAILDYTIEVLIGSTQVRNWTLLYQSGHFQLLMEGAYIQDVNSGVQYDNIQSIMNLLISGIPANVQEGDSWTFITYPYNTDFDIADYSIPVIGVEDFTINVEEQFIKN